MINLEITGVHLEITPQMKKYVDRKLGRLDKYLSRSARESAHGSVFITQEDGKSKNKFTAEIILNLPHEVVTAKESTINAYAAVDIIEAKAKTQILRHKDKAQNNRKQRRTRRTFKDFKFRNPFGKD